MLLWNEYNRPNRLSDETSFDEFKTFCEFVIHLYSCLPRLFLSLLSVTLWYVRSAEWLKLLIRIWQTSLSAWPSCWRRSRSGKCRYVSLSSDWVPPSSALYTRFQNLTRLHKQFCFHPYYMLGKKAQSQECIIPHLIQPFNTAEHMMFLQNIKEHESIKYLSNIK